MSETAECGCVVFDFNYVAPCPEHEHPLAKLRGRAYGRLFSQFAMRHDRMPAEWENVALLAAADGHLTYPKFKTIRESKGGR